MSKLVILDFSNLVFKSYYGIKFPMKSPEGVPTNAIYGFWHSLFKILELTAPTHLVACLEGKDRENNPRRVLYPAYKANRSAPDDIKIQLPLIEQQLMMANLSCLRVDPYEADDVIASLMKQGQTYFNEIIVFSVDKDLLQYVNHKTYLMDISVLKKMDENFVKEKYSLNPNQISEYLSIMGDSSDNIPGVPGVGPKGAQAILKEHSTIENFLAKGIAVTKAEKLVLENKQILELSRNLVRVYDNLALPAWSAFELSFKVTAELKSEFTELKIKSILDKLYFFET